MTALATRSSALVAGLLATALALGVLAGIDARLGVLAALGLVFVIRVLDDLMLGVLFMGFLAFFDTLPAAGAFSPAKLVGALLVDRPDPALSDRLSLPTARQLVHEAEALADYVVIDSPPLTEIIDALPLAQEASEVLVVVRLGRSRTGKLVQLGEMLTQHGIEPAGIALVGVERPARDGYYYTQDNPQAKQKVSAG